ncbi:hypothetical protein Tco_0507092, partial [Tanacetum coccineum]
MRVVVAYGGGNEEVVVVVEDEARGGAWCGDRVDQVTGKLFGARQEYSSDNFSGGGDGGGGR